MPTPVEQIIPALAPLMAKPSPGNPITKEMVRVYAQCLSDLTLAQVERAVLMCLNDAGERYYPTPGILRRYVETPRDLSVEAARVYEAIGPLERHNPHSGGYWIEGEIRQHLGDAAAEAFVAAGGSPARTRSDDTWTRKAFAESYAAAARSVPPPVLPEPSRLYALARAPYKPLTAPLRVAGLIAATVAHVTPPTTPRTPGTAPLTVQGERSPAEAPAVPPRGSEGSRGDVAGRNGEAPRAT